MAETAITTSECAWSAVSVQVLGRKLTGLRGFSNKKSVEKEPLYASGPDPVDITTGNKKYEGNLKLLKYELDLMNDAAQAAGYEDITEVPHTLISIVTQYKKNETDPIRTISAMGVAFMEMDEAMEQNAKMTEVTLNWIAMKIVHTKR